MIPGQQGIGLQIYNSTPPTATILSLTRPNMPRFVLNASAMACPVVTRGQQPQQQQGPNISTNPLVLQQQQRIQSQVLLWDLTTESYNEPEKWAECSSE